MGAVRLAVSIPEGAEAVGISYAGMKRLIAAGRVRTVVLGRRRRVIPVKELQRMIARGLRVEL